MGGYLLAGRELGLDVLGIEPSQQHSKIARETLDLPVVNGYFVPEKILPGQFDIILSSHVIEHQMEPEVFINDMLKVLKNKGLLIIVTPNAESSLYLVLRRFWSMLKPVDHVSLLTKKAFLGMGFNQTVKMEFEQSEYPWEFGAGLISGIISIKNYFLKIPVDTKVKISLAGKSKGRHFVLKLILKWLSSPFYFLDVLTSRQACLQVYVKKSRTTAC